MLLKSSLNLEEKKLNYFVKKNIYIYPVYIHVFGKGYHSFRLTKTKKIGFLIYA